MLIRAGLIASIRMHVPLRHRQEYIADRDGRFGAEADDGSLGRLIVSKQPPAAGLF